MREFGFFGLYVGSIWIVDGLKWFYDFIFLVVVGIVRMMVG